MTLDDWRKEAAAHAKKVKAAENKYHDAIANRNGFFRLTVGFAPGDLATVEGTVTLIEFVTKMLGKKGKRK